MTIKVWNADSGDLGCGYLGVTERGEIRSDRVTFNFAPKKGRLGGSVGFEDFCAGTYLLFLDWEPPKAEKSGGFPNSLLQDYYMTRWITVKEREEKTVKVWEIEGRRP